MGGPGSGRRPGGGKGKGKIKTHHVKRSKESREKIKWITMGTKTYKKIGKKPPVLQKWDNMSQRFYNAPIKRSR